MTSEEKSNKEEENNSDNEEESNPQSPENNETNSITNESTDKNKGKEKKFLGKKTERDGKKTNHDYCSSCLKKGKLLNCEDCERSYHMKCLKLEEKNIPEGPWFCPICSLKKEKKEKKEKKNKKIKKETKIDKKESKKEIKKDIKKEVKKDKKINTNKKDNIKKKEKSIKKKVKENNKESDNNEETNEEKEEKEEKGMDLDEEKEENNETTEKNDSNEEPEKNENSNESNEKTEKNDESGENQEEEKENIKKKKPKKKVKKNVLTLAKAQKKNSGDKNEKRDKSPDKTPDKTKKEKEKVKEKVKEKEKIESKEDKDKFAITTIRSKRLQERQKQKEKERLEKEMLEKEKLEKEKEKKDKASEKEKITNVKTQKKKGKGKTKKTTIEKTEKGETTEYKDVSENKNSGSSNDEEIYTEDVVNNNQNIKSELLAFLKKLTMKEVKNNPIEKLNIPEEISNSIKDEKSLKQINNMVSTDKSFNKYKNLWNTLVDKVSEPEEKTNQKIVNYPIRCKDLYDAPEFHGLEEKYMQKTNGILYPYFNGKTFNKVIGIYDFLSTFANKIYLDKFSLEEFYSALLKSETYTKSEIGLLSSIHVSLSYLLISELLEYPIQDLYSNGEKELLIVKENVEYKKDDLNKLYSYIYYSWPELVRLFLKSKTFSKDISMEVNYDLLPVLDKIYKCKDVIAYNTSLNFEEKLLILENLVVISYETNFIREIIKEANDVLNKYKKQKKDLDEELKSLDSNKIEFERYNKLTQPQNRIDEINQKLSELGQNKTRSAGDKMRLKLENEKQVLEDMIREMGENNVLRDDTINKLKEVKKEIFNVQTIGRTNIGIDGRGYKYFYFNWMPNIIFMRAKNKYSKEKYEWRIINDLDILKNDLIDKLSEKGIEELDLKDNLELIYNKLTNKIKENESKETKVIMDEENPNEEEKEKEKEKKNNNDKEVKMEIENDDNIDVNKNGEKNNNDEKKKEEFIPQSLDAIFDNQVLKYENSLNPNINISLNTSNNNNAVNKQNRIILITSEINQYEPIYERVKKLEINMTKYLVLDNRQWESQANRSKIKSWMSTINSLDNFVNLLLFFHERIKIPYKSETLSFADFIFGKSATRKIIEEEKEEDENEGDIKNKSCPLIVNGNLDYNYVNRDLTFANRIKLWTKEFETFNIEKIYLEYLKNVKSIPQYLICLSLFEMMIIELNKRRDMCKRKGDNFIPEIVKNDENKTNENGKDNYNKIVIKKPDIKKRKLIQWNVKCMFCHEFGELLCCEECPNVAHLACAKLTKLPDAWKCSFCVDNMKI